MAPVKAEPSKLILKVLAVRLEGTKTVLPPIVTVPAPVAETREPVDRLALVFVVTNRNSLAISVQPSPRVSFIITAAVTTSRK